MKKTSRAVLPTHDTELSLLPSGELHTYWTAMPEFQMGDAEPSRNIVVRFMEPRDVDLFASLMAGHPTWDQAVAHLRTAGLADAADQLARARPDSRPCFSVKLSARSITKTTNSLLFENPDEPDDYHAPTEYIYTSHYAHTPRYPIYVISKGRSHNPLTAEVLRGMRVPHRVVVEPQEQALYAAALGPDRLIVAPENFSARGQGSIPVRNFVWDHAVAEGHARHWVMDDNIRGFVRLNRNRRLPCDDGAVLRAVEDFTDRYENVGLSGLNYQYFIPDRGEKFPPYFLNTRVYSCILVNHAVDAPWRSERSSGDGIRWRGRYNEDTDLSIRVLEAGWCTFLVNAFAADKVTTGASRGGNEQIYDESWGEGVEIRHDGDRVVMGTETHRGLRRVFAEALYEQHPALVDIVWRYERWHHEVNYAPFKPPRNTPRLRADYAPPADPEYGMELWGTEKRAHRYPRLPPINAPLAPVAQPGPKAKPQPAPQASPAPPEPQAPVTFAPRRAAPPASQTPIETFATQNASLLDAAGDAPIAFNEDL